MSLNLKCFKKVTWGIFQVRINGKLGPVDIDIGIDLDDIDIDIQ